MCSSALDGVFMAALLKVSFLAAGDLVAPRLAVMFAAAVTAFPMVLTPIIAPWAGTLDRRKLFWACGLVGRASFVLLAVVDHWFPFLLIGATSWFAMPFILPAYHLYWQRAYPTALRGRLWGRAELLRGLVMVTCFLWFGQALELSPEARHWIYPVGGVCGAAALIMIGYIKLPERREPPREAAKRGVSWRGAKRVLKPWRPAIELLKQQWSFRAYEVGFMLYGFGFMLCNFLRDDHFARDEGVRPLQFAGFLIISQLAMPLASPFYGVLFDRAKAAWTTAVACSLLVPYALLLAGSHSMWGIWLSGAAMGVGMAGIHVCWNLGTVEFAGKGDPSPYTAVHAAAVGLRAMAALPVAWLIQWQFEGNARPVFGVAAVFFLAAVLWQLRLGYQQRAAGEVVTRSAVPPAAKV
jgi:MFS family permease